MKIALIGFGKMGRAVESAAIRRGHSVVARLTSSQGGTNDLLQADMCIDFTHAGCIADNVRKAVEMKKNIVIGTTGWESQMELVRSMVETGGIGALHSPNFSTGVHLLLSILDQASRTMHPFPEYEVAGLEYHHSQKRDFPSGTALKISHAIEKNMGRKIPFTSVRCGSIPGTHTVIFDSPFDTITIAHEARNRDGFAEGAVHAAEWLAGRKGLFTYQDCMDDRSGQ